MNVIDIRTLLITQTLSYALCTGVIVLLWHQNRRRFAGLDFWLAHSAMQTFGMALIMLRDIAPDWLSIIVGNALAAGGMLCLYIGLERFVGQRSRQYHNGVLLLAFILLHIYFTYARPSLAARNINITVVLTVICFQCAWLLLRRVGPEMRVMTRWPGFLGAAYGVLGVVRIVVNSFVSPGDDFLRGASLLDALLIMVYQLFFIAITFSLFLMLNYRLFADVQVQQMALQEGEARYRQLIEFLPDALVVHCDGRIVFVNSAAVTMLGAASSDGLLNQTVLEFVHPDDHDLVQRRAAAILATGKPAPVVVAKLFRIGGDVIDVEIMTARLEYHGQPALQALVRDISERKQAEAVLQESAESYRFITESISDVIWTLDVETLRFSYVSPSVERLRGYTAEEVMARPMDASLTSEHTAYIREVMRERLVIFLNDEKASQSQSFVEEVQQPCKDGTLVWAEIFARFVRNPRTGRVEVHGVSRDISERKRAEAQLQESKALLEQTVRTLEDRERFLTMLNDVTYVALGTPDLPAMLQVLADRLGEVFHADGCYITLWDEAKQVVVPAAAYGPLRDTYPRERPIVRDPAQPREWTMTESVLLAGHTLVAEDVFNTPYLSSRIAAQYPTRSMLGLPLIAGERKLGAALIAYDTPHRFTTDEIARAEQTAQQISLAVAKSLLLRESHSLWQEAETLREAVLALTSALDHDEVMDRILAQLQQVVPYDTASVQLLRDVPDAGKQWLEIVGGRGFTNWEQILGVTFDPEASDNPNYEVIRSRAPFIVDDGPAVYEGFRRSPHAEAGIHSWLGAPMFVGDRMIGMITLDKTEPGFYTPEHARLAEAFAAQAAIAIENARLYRALRDHAGQLEAQNLELRKLTLAIEQSGSIIEITDNAGLIQYVNPRFEEVTGYTVSEMLGRDHSYLYSGEQSADFYQVLWDTIRSGQIWRGEFRNKRKDGSRYWESATIAPVQDAAGQTTNYIAIKEDITARKEAEEALHRNAEQLAAQNAELDAFAHTVAHDLREPLGLVIGYARLLEQEYHGLSSADLAASIQTMRRYSEKLDIIIKELLLLARIRKEEVIPVPLSMAEIVQEAFTRLALTIQETKARVIIPDPATWPVALGYAPWVEEVWTNYISNALKYGGRPQEGIPPHVELGYTILEAGSSKLDPASSIEHPATSIQFWVRDNGLGLTLEAQAKLFTPFTRLEQVRAQGHGLGLSIVRRIAEKLGGEVGVISAPGEGSCFYFTLPREKNHDSSLLPPLRSRVQ